MIKVKTLVSEEIEDDINGTDKIERIGEEEGRKY